MLQRICWAIVCKFLFASMTLLSVFVCAVKTVLLHINFMLRKSAQESPPD